MYSLLNMWIFHCHVSLPEGILICPDDWFATQILEPIFYGGLGGDGYLKLTNRGSDLELPPFEQHILDLQVSS